MIIYPKKNQEFFTPQEFFFFGFYDNGNKIIILLIYHDKKKFKKKTLGLSVGFSPVLDNPRAVRYDPVQAGAVTARRKWNL
jgi:hypothetical protein